MMMPPMNSNGTSNFQWNVGVRNLNAAPINTRANCFEGHAEGRVTPPPSSVYSLADAPSADDDNVMDMDESITLGGHTGSMSRCRSMLSMETASNRIKPLKSILKKSSSYCDDLNDKDKLEPRQVAAMERKERRRQKKRAMRRAATEDTTTQESPAWTEEASRLKAAATRAVAANSNSGRRRCVSFTDLSRWNDSFNALNMTSPCHQPRRRTSAERLQVTPGRTRSQSDPQVSAMADNQNNNANAVWGNHSNGGGGTGRRSRSSRTGNATTTATTNTTCSTTSMSNSNSSSNNKMGAPRMPRRPGTIEQDNISSLSAVPNNQYMLRQPCRRASMEMEGAGAVGLLVAAKMSDSTAATTTATPPVTTTTTPTLRSSSSPMKQTKPKNIFQSKVNDFLLQTAMNAVSIS